MPRNLSEPGSEKRASDILRSTDQYRIDIQSNPTVPILNISAQAPNKEAAERLANGAVDGLRDYLAALAIRQGTDPKKQVRLEQLGRARGGVINNGIGLQIALLSFIFVFVLSAAPCSSSPACAAGGAAAASRGGARARRRRAGPAGAEQGRLRAANGRDIA